MNVASPAPAAPSRPRFGKFLLDFARKQSSDAESGEFNGRLLARRQAGTAAVFLLTGLWIWWMIARRFTIQGDEGIFVEGARRVLSGQVPYKDFFILMGPGTFWLQALALRVFGVTLAGSRAIMILDLSILAACVFWLVSRRLSLSYAAWTATLLVFLESSDRGIMIPTHRWDSAALGMLAITICASRPRRLTVFAAGCCAGFAAWTTLPVALVAAELGVWLWLEDRPKIVPFLAGCVAVSIGCAGVLALQGALGPMFEHMFWTASNYGHANYLPYGSLFGQGYGQFFDGAQAFEVPVRALVVFGLILPVLLPPLAVLAFPWWRGDSLLRLLFLGGAALVASTYPRTDLSHLTYAAPVFYALTAILAASIPWATLRVSLLSLCTVSALLYAGNALARHGEEETIATSVGAIRGPHDDIAFVRDLQREVPSGSSLFVFPYLPMASFLTLGSNPTRYSFLQPGMMNEQDESMVLADLAKAPPDRVLYFDFPEWEVLKIWPPSDRSHLRFRRLEAYFSAHYHRSNVIHTPKRDFEILEHETGDRGGDPEARITPGSDPPPRR